MFCLVENNGVVSFENIDENGVYNIWIIINFPCFKGFVGADEEGGWKPKGEGKSSHFFGSKYTEGFDLCIIFY